MKRIYMATIAILLVISVMLSFGAECSSSFTTASISEATMALGVDSYAKPINPTNQFYTDTPTIYCSAKYSNAPADTEINSIWVYQQGELGLTNCEIGSYAMTVEGTGYLYFYMDRPNNGWPLGEYKLVLYLDGEQAASLPFTIQAK
jgi:hypothetical protein